MSRTGIGLCTLYAIIIITGLIVAYGGDGTDYKGEFVALQLPIVLQLTLIEKIGLFSFFEKAKISWLGIYIILGVPTFAFLYFTGWVFDKLFRPSLWVVYIILIVPILAVLSLILVIITSIGGFSNSFLKTNLFIGGPALILILLMLWGISKLSR